MSRETALSANKYIYKILTEDATLSGLTKGQIYPVIAEENVTYPFVIFSKTDAYANYTKDILAYDSATIQVAIAAVNYFQTVDIAERVRALLEGRRDSYFANVQFVSVTEDYVEDAYTQTLEFNCQIRV